MIKNVAKRFKPEHLAFLCVIMLLAVILLRRPIIGVADNGDFARIMRSTGLHYLTNDPEEKYFGYVNRLYRTGYIIPFGGGYFSTQILLVLAAVYLSGSFSGSDVFDIRYLAAIYIVILAFTVCQAVKCIRKRSASAAILAVISFVIIFCDTAYTSYFNSLYGEPVTFVSLLFMSAMAYMIAAEEKPSIPVLILFSAGVIIFAGAKVQNVPAGILATLLFIRIAALRKDKIWRRLCAAAAAAVVVVSFAAYFSISRDIRICNKYQTVFFGILKESPDPAADLEELGLDPSLAVLAGTNYFMEDYAVDIRTAEFRKMIDENISHIEVAAFYARHPDCLLKKLHIAAENGFKLNQGFGNYENYEGTEYKKTTDVFCMWSDLKMEVLPHSLLFISAFFGLILLVLICEYSRAYSKHKRLLIEYFGFIALTGIMQFVLPIIGDGEADLSKHLFMFNVCFDIFVCSAPVYAMVKIAALLRHFSKNRLMARLRTD